MFINRLSLKQFRNYQQATVEFKKILILLLEITHRGKQV